MSLEGMSEIYLCMCSLEYEDVVCDGLYDPWGSFPELHPFERSHVFPSLADLKAIEFHEGDIREVGIGMFLYFTPIIMILGS